MKIAPSQINNIFKLMYEAIGGENNPDIKTYRERSKTVDRDVFFREAVWAIWAAGKSRVANQSFLDRAVQNGFEYNFRLIASWDKKQQSQFVESLHGWTTGRGRPSHRPVPKRAIGRWNSIFHIARELSKYPTEQAFRDALFEGKTESVLLGPSNVSKIVSLKIPYLKEVTAQFLVKNMGGEAIKKDRWIDEFLNYYGISKYELEQLLANVDIPFGLFDTVLWCYCEKFIHETKAFKQHFDYKYKSA
jgi:hypothetical protein